MAMTPDEQGVFYVLIVSGGPGAGEFTYDASGNLRSSNVGQATTDPIQGISCPQGFATYNGHGAVLNLLSTSATAAGFFQYFDNGSAVQGALILAVASTSGTDPVKGTAYVAGLTGIDPVFGDTIVTVGVNITLIQALFTANALITANTGSGTTSPFVSVAGPEQGHAGHAVLRVYGVSADGTVPQGVIISGTDPPVRAAKALLEVQGSQVLTGIATPAAPPAGDVLAFSDTTGFLRTLAGLAGDTNVYQHGWARIYLANDQLINSLAMANVLTFAGVGARRYRVRAVIWFTTTVSTGQAALQVASSGAASAVAIDYENGPFSGAGTTNRGILTALAAANNSQGLSNGVEQVIKLEGSVVLSAAGNLGIQMACTLAATNTYTVKAQSFLEISPS